MFVSALALFAEASISDTNDDVSAVGKTSTCFPSSATFTNGFDVPTVDSVDFLQ